MRALTRGVSLLLLTVVLAAGCGQGGGDLSHGDGREVDEDEPGHGDMSDDLDGKEIEEIPPRPLTADGLERYYAAQVDWRMCAVEAGLDLPEPPSLEVFLADEGRWSVFADLTDDDWNRHIAGDESESGGMVGARCGEPPFEGEFRVEEEALRRLHRFQVELAACLATEGYELDLDSPTEEEFVASGGRNWNVWGELRERVELTDQQYGSINERCGSSLGELPLDLHSFEIDPAVLEGRYESLLALKACLEEAGFVLPDPPPRDAYLAGDVGTNWQLWTDAYRHNDRDQLQAFADGLDQACPGHG
jgi:hypothetical protein